MTLAVVAILAVLTVSIFAAGIYSTVVDIFSNETHVPAVERVRELADRGFSRRVHQRFYLWLHGGQAPDPEETWWWRQDAEDAEERGLSNEEAWYNSYAYQPSQALYGVSDGPGYW